MIFSIINYLGGKDTIAANMGAKVAMDTPSGATGPPQKFWH